MKPEIESDV